MHAHEQPGPDTAPQPDAPASPCHCANLRHAARAVTGLYDAFLAPAGLKVTQYSLLRHVARLEPVNMTDLARSMRLDRTTLARNTRPLEAQGLVQAAPGLDQRRHELSLTDKGRETLGKASLAWAEAQRRLESSLGEENLGKLLELLGHLQGLAG